MNNTNTAVATKPPVEKVESLIRSDKFNQEVCKALPKHLPPDRFVRSVLVAIQKTPKLRQCSVDSIFSACLQLSALGLEANGRSAHLIPYGNECRPMVDYKGLVEMAYRSGDVLSIHADLICENDIFKYNLGEIQSHEIDWKAPRGEAYAVYALARMKSGVVASAVMSKDEVETIRKASPGGNGDIWRKHWGEMAKKTVFKRLSKWLPLSADIRDAAAIDDDIEDDFVPKTTDTGTTRRKPIEAEAIMENNPDPEPVTIVKPVKEVFRKPSPEPEPEPTPDPEPLPEPPLDDNEIPFGNPEPPKPAKPAKAENPVVASIRGWMSEVKVPWDLVSEIANSQGWWAGNIALEDLPEDSLQIVETNKRGVLSLWKKKAGGAK